MSIKYINIPTSFALDKNLKNKMVRQYIYGYICGLSAKNKVCYASNQYLASNFGTTPAIIRNEISALKKLGYVDIVDTKVGRGLVKSNASLDNDCHNVVTNASLDNDDSVIGKLHYCHNVMTNNRGYNNDINSSSCSNENTTTTTTFVPKENTVVSNDITPNTTPFVENLGGAENLSASPALTEKQQKQELIALVREFQLQHNLRPNAAKTIVEQLWENFRDNPNRFSYIKSYIIEMSAPYADKIYELPGVLGKANNIGKEDFALVDYHDDFWGIKHSDRYSRLTANAVALC